MKFLLRFLLFLIIIFAVLLTPIFLWSQTDSGIKVINNFVTEYIEKKPDHNYKVKIENIKLSFPLVIEVQKMAFSDKEGQFIVIENFCIDVAPSLLWFWHGNIWGISAQTINLLRLPNSNLSSIDRGARDQTDIGFIPGITIQDIAVRKFILSSELTGFVDDIAFDLGGHMDFDSKNKKLRFLAKLQASIAENVLLDKKLSLMDNALLELEGEFNFSNNNINIGNFKLSSFHSNIEGMMDINFAENLLTGTAKYDSSILEYLFSDRKSLKSLFTGKIDFSGEVSAPHIITDGNISLNDGDQNYFQLPNLNLKSDFIFNKEGLDGKILIDGGGIKASGELGKDGSKFYLKNFSAKGKSLISTASLVFDNKTQVATGVFNINSSNVYEFKEFFPFLQKGQLDIKTIYKQNTSGVGQINVSGNAKHLSTSFASCDFINLDLGIKNFWNFKLDHVDIKLRSFVTDHGTLKSFTLKAKGENDLIDFVSHVESVNPYLINLKVDGKLISSDLEKIRDGNNATFQIINNVSGVIGKTRIMTREPITITFGKVISILVPDLKANDGKLNVDLTLDNSQVKGKLVSDKFPLSVVSNILPSAFDHSLASVKAELSGNLQSPVFDSELEISNIGLLVKDGIPVILKLSSRIRNNNLSTHAQVLQEKKVLGDLELQMPCNLSLLPFEFSVSKQGDIAAKLKLNKEVNILALLPLPVGHKLSGYLSGEIAASGSIDSPIINGTISITKAEYKYQLYGIKLKNISTKIVAQNKNISILNFVAYDNYSHLLEGKGDLSIYADLPFKFHVNTKKFSFINPPYLQGEVGGALSISGNNKKALAKGSFDLGPMEIKIPEHFLDNIPTINIIENGYGEKAVYNIQNKPYILEMDVNLNAKQQVYVRGGGVNTLLSGNLKITNDITDPHIFGMLKSVRGRYQEFGKFLTVRKGVLTFDGPISPSPYLNIAGVTVVGDTEIRLVLAGSIFTPDISIESTPALSQQDALSLLLFGKNPDSISTMQAIGLADGMRKLSGHGGGFDPLGLGRKILGVDDISIKNNEDTESSYVGVGKHLTDKVYLEIEQGDQAFGTKTKVEVEVTPKMAIEAITGEKGDSSFGINWRFDY